jgi:hypothetical protein
MYNIDKKNMFFFWGQTFQLGRLSSSFRPTRLKSHSTLHLPRKLRPLKKEPTKSLKLFLIG